MSESTDACVQGHRRAGHEVDPLVRLRSRTDRQRLPVGVPVRATDVDLSGSVLGSCRGRGGPRQVAAVQGPPGPRTATQLPAPQLALHPAAEDAHVPVAQRRGRRTGGEVAAEAGPRAPSAAAVRPVPELTGDTGDEDVGRRPRGHRGGSVVDTSAQRLPAVRRSVERPVPQPAIQAGDERPGSGVGHQGGNPGRRHDRPPRAVPVTSGSVGQAGGGDPHRRAGGRGALDRHVGATDPERLAHREGHVAGIPHDRAGLEEGGRAHEVGGEVCQNARLEPLAVARRRKPRVVTDRGAVLEPVDLVVVDDLECPHSGPVPERLQGVRHGRPCFPRW